MSEEKIKFLVADTTAFINHVPLNDYAEEILTVPDVVNEVKSKRQIRRLCVLPYDLKVREPHTENVVYVTNYSKKTGDYASLSAIDLKVIALTYELHKEHLGTDNLRSEPAELKIIASKQKPEELIDKTKLAGFYVPKRNRTSTNSTDDNEESLGAENEEQITEPDKLNIKEEISSLENEKDKDDTGIESDNSENNSTDDEIEDDLIQENIEKYLKELSLEEPSKICDEILAPEKANSDEEDNDDSNDEDEAVNEEEEEDDDDDDTAWITPSNIQKVKKSMAGNVEEQIVPEVACMSTDFAIQNVLKQINLNICALNGRIIKHVRTYILRCYACFKTTSIITKVFCPNCGNRTMKKVAVSLDENGKQIIHINTKRPLTTKYKNQSVPRFQGGKHSRNPIITEDQPIPKQMPSRVAKTKTNALDEDYTAGFSPFVTRDVDSKSALLRSKGNIKEWAKNNTFEELRRKKRFNRLVK